MSTFPPLVCTPQNLSHASRLSLARKILSIFFSFSLSQSMKSRLTHHLFTAIDIGIKWKKEFNKICAARRKPLKVLFETGLNASLPPINEWLGIEFNSGCVRGGRLRLGEWDWEGVRENNRCIWNRISAGEGR